jgi:hypothetical protein
MAFTMAVQRSMTRSESLSLVILLAILLSSHARAFQPYMSSLQSFRMASANMLHPPRAPSRWSSSSQLNLSPRDCLSLSKALLMRGGEVPDLMESAYDWTVNLGAPAALIAGAVFATI